jgi:hydrogenase-4 component B
VYVGFLRGAGGELPAAGALATAGATAALALVGGLAAACFAKAFGVVFLGEGRSDATRSAHECGLRMRASMAFLALACVAIGFFPALAARVVLPIGAEVAAALARAPEPAAVPEGSAAIGSLEAVSRAAWVLAGVVAAVALARAALLARRPVASGRTWGCGYGAPSPRMQYTASSFADPLLRLGRSVLRPRVHDAPPAGYFPHEAERSTHTGDLIEDALLRPAVRGAGRALHSLRWMQGGQLQSYLLYILIAVVCLLLYQYGSAP